MINYILNHDAIILQQHRKMSIWYHKCIRHNTVFLRQRHEERTVINCFLYNQCRICIYFAWMLHNTLKFPWMNTHQDYMMDSNLANVIIQALEVQISVMFSAKFRCFNLKQISYVCSCFFKCFNHLKCRTSTSWDRKFSSGNTESFACVDLFGRAAPGCIYRHMIWTNHSCIRLGGLKGLPAFLYGYVPWGIWQRSPTQSGSFCGSVSRPDFSGKGIQCSANLCNLHSAAWEKISIFW